jgi:hypothetical protein
MSSAFIAFLCPFFNRFLSKMPLFSRPFLSTKMLLVEEPFFVKIFKNKNKMSEYMLVSCE